MTSRLLLVAALLAACGGAPTSDSASDNLDAYRHKRHHDGGVPHHDGGVPHVDGGVPDAGGQGGGTVPIGGACSVSDDCEQGGLCAGGACVASACDQRHSGVSGIRATIRIDQYLGLRNGHSGTHELANGTLQEVLWMFQPSLRDTSAVQLAMNVASATDPQGLPHEVPLSPGEVVEVEGEWVPGASAGLSGRAVIHYTHGSCGYATLGGVTY